MSSLLESRRGRVRPGRPTVLFPLLIVLGAGFFLCAGCASLRQHWLDGQTRAYRAASGCLLVLLAVVQLRLAVAAWRMRDQLDAARFGPRSAYWRWLLGGALICYLALLALGPDANMRYVFRAAVGGWYTAMLLPLLSPAGFDAPCWAWRRGPLPRLAARLACAVLMTLLAAELAARAYSVLGDVPLSACYVAQPASTVENSESRPRRSGVRRVAVLGDETTLYGSPQSNFLARLNRRPNLELYNFGANGTGPKEYLAMLAAAAKLEPDVMLTLISVGDDVTLRTPPPGYFNWRWLHSVQLVSRWFATPNDASPSPPPAAASDRESYLRAAARRLDVCRRPLSGKARRQWNQTFSELDALARACTRRGIRLALVAVPDECQVDQQLRRTLCRRLGRPPSGIDVQMPQRRLSLYAKQRELPLLDLLPHFRAAGQPLYERNSQAFNEEGNRLAADVIGAWLAQTR